MNAPTILCICSMSCMALPHAANAEEPRQVSLASLFPLTQEEMVDESTLKATIVSESVVQRTVGSAQELRWVEVRFFSHHWKDGPWYGTIHAVIPKKIALDRQGLVAMCPLGSGHIQKGLDIRRDFFEETARRFGIPVVSIPSMGEHFGVSRIHAMCDKLILKFLETRDPGWLPGYPTSAVRARALTMVGQMTGHPTSKAIHLGSSITANKAWIWPVYDERVKGLVATGDIGFREDTVSPSFKRSKRPVFEAISKADSALRKLLSQHTDPYVFGDQIRCDVLQVAGTNDFASPPSTLSKFLPAIAGRTHLVSVPNYAHGSGSHRHLTAFRMWIDHIFFERPLSTIEILRTDYTAVTLTITVRIEQRELQTGHVQFVYATTSEPKFLRSRFLNDTPRANHVEARWKFASMEPTEPESNEWTVTFRVPAPASRFVAGFVDVTDQSKNTVGYAASPMLWLSSSYEPQ